MTTRKTPSLPTSVEEEKVTFIDNAEDRIVLEYDADFYEEKFDTPRAALEHLLNEDAANWVITKREYTGKVYILTMLKHVGVV